MQIHPYVQEIIASTNGIHYTDKVNNVFEYPVYNLPVPEAENESLMLDIGSGWGRWQVAGSNKGYIPIGVDLRLKMCQTAQYSLKEQGKAGYNVVGDLENLPFKDGIFDLIWSFSVIQHTHKDKMLSCLGHINRMLTSKGMAKLEFPNKDGIRNRFGVAQKWEQYRDVRSGEHHMHVRYYGINEYRKFFNDEFGNFDFTNHSFIGIGVLPEDLKYVTWKNKILCAISLLGSQFTRVIPGLKNLSDSIYIMAKSRYNKVNGFYDIIHFIEKHQANPNNNLNVIDLLRCPKTGNNVNLEGDRIVVENANIYYPVVDNIPVMLIEEARKI